MKAARLHAVGDLRVADEPVPVAGPGECLVRVTSVGICGSDLHWWDEAGHRGLHPGPPAGAGARGRGRDRGGTTAGRAGGHRPGHPVRRLPALPGRLPQPVHPHQVRWPWRPGWRPARVHDLARRAAVRAAGHAQRHRWRDPGAARGRHPRPGPGSPAARRDGGGGRLRADRAAAHPGAPGRRGRRDNGVRAAGAPPGGGCRPGRGRRGPGRGGRPGRAGRADRRGSGRGLRGGGQRRGRAAGHGGGPARRPRRARRHPG